MENHAMLQDIILMLNQIAHEQGLNTVIESDQRSGTLTISGFSINIGLLEYRKIILFQSPIAILPQENQLELFKRLLVANNLFTETSGATLGLDAENSLITLQIAWPFEFLTYTSLTDLVGNVVILTGEWIEKVHRFMQENTYTNSDQQIDNTQQMLAV